MSQSHLCNYDGVAASRFHTGEMDVEERTRFAAHMERCAACARAVRAQGRIDELIYRLPTYHAPVRLLTADRPRRTIVRRVGAVLLVAAAVAFLLLRTEQTALPQLVSEALAADAAALAGMRSGGSQAMRGAEAVHIPWLGFVTCSDPITPAVDGVYLCALRRNTPLARAGVRAGDVLVSIEARPVPSDTAMYEELAQFSVGDEITVTVRADGVERRLQVGLIERRLGPRHPFDMDWSPALVASLDRPRVPDEDLDQIFVPLSDSAAAGLSAPAGILVGRAPPRESTERTILSALPYLFGPEGLRSGDVITAVHGRPVRTRWELVKALIDSQRIPFTLTVHRAGEILELAFRKAPASEKPTRPAPRL